MGYTEDKYISLLTDFGFKRIFGTAVNKDLLISFLNTLLDGEQVIRDLYYLNGEKVGDIYTERKAIFDVYCESEKGEKFIVEMQNAYQVYFKDRTVFYSTFANAHLFSARQSKASFDCSRLSKSFPLREQAPKGGDWDFRLTPVYIVAIVNFCMNDDAFDPKAILHTVKLCDTVTKRVFYDKLTYVYVELAKFNKTEDELETMYDKWLYVLKNLSKLSERPKALQERIFQRLFKQAEIAAFTPSEQHEYENSMKAYRDVKNSINSAWDEGHEQGIEEGIEKGRDERSVEIARNMLALGFDAAQVARATGLDVESIVALKN